MKSASAGLNTHIQLGTTTLAQYWKVKRTDDTVFYFTSHDIDDTIDIGDGDGPAAYEAETSFKRTAISNNDELSVDNLDVEGLLRSGKITEEDLRKGLFDFAEVWVFIANYENLADGFIKMRRGWFGEVTITPKGIFKTELRGLTQVLSRIRSDIYEAECPYDLGDPDCGITLLETTVIPRSTALVVGDEYRIPLAVTDDDCAAIAMSFEGVDAATSGPGFVNDGFEGDPTIVGVSQIDTAQAPASGSSTSSLLLNGTTDYLSWTDRANLEFGALPVTVRAHFRLNAVGANQTIMSKYDTTADQRSWFLRVDSSNNLEFVTYQSDGSTIDVQLTGATALTTGVDYHAAAVRKTDGDWVLFLDGAVEQGPTTPTGDSFSGTAPVMVGALLTATVAADFFNGWIDSAEVNIGRARWEIAFTAPTGNLTPAKVTWTEAELGNVVYRVTIAGTTDPCYSVPTATFATTHAQGGATLQARGPWMWQVIVSALGTDVRKNFSVTELTPATGSTTPGREYFPDDSMNGGVAKWLSGTNSGRGMEIKNFVADDGFTIVQDIDLFLDMPFDISIGDIVQVYRGCDKSRATCRDIFENAREFGGYPDVPGQTVFTYPDLKS